MFLVRFEVQYHLLSKKKQFSMSCYANDVCCCGDTFVYVPFTPRKLVFDSVFSLLASLFVSAFQKMRSWYIFCLIISGIIAKARYVWNYVISDVGYCLLFIIWRAPLKIYYYGVRKCLLRLAVIIIGRKWSRNNCYANSTDRHIMLCNESVYEYCV